MKPLKENQKKQTARTPSAIRAVITTIIFSLLVLSLALFLPGCDTEAVTGYSIQSKSGSDKSFSSVSYVDIEFASSKSRTDNDLDNVPNIDDICPNTPEDEPVNSEGCSCSQLEAANKIDDSNFCTDDSCENGIITHTPNSEEATKLTLCPLSKCYGDEYVKYPGSGKDYCKDGELVEWDCTETSRAYSYDCAKKDPNIIDDKSGSGSSSSGSSRWRGGGSSSGGSSSSGSTEAVGVPEFSTYTLGLAVIFGCLGLVLLRKRH